MRAVLEVTTAVGIVKDEDKGVIQLRSCAIERGAVKLIGLNGGVVVRYFSASRRSPS